MSYWRSHDQVGRRGKGGVPRLALVSTARNHHPPFCVSKSFGSVAWIRKMTFEENLINEVRTHPIVWNKWNEDYKNRLKSDKEWAIIARNLNKTSKFKLECF